MYVLPFSPCSDGTFMATAEHIRLPDDCTVGYIVEALLGASLIRSALFHSHLENLGLVSDMHNQVNPGTDKRRKTTTALTVCRKTGTLSNQPLVLLSGDSQLRRRGQQQKHSQCERTVHSKRGPYEVKSVCLTALQCLVDLLSLMQKATESMKHVKCMIMKAGISRKCSATVTVLC